MKDKIIELRNNLNQFKETLDTEFGVANVNAFLLAGYIAIISNMILDKGLEKVIEYNDLETKLNNIKLERAYLEDSIKDIELEISDVDIELLSYIEDNKDFMVLEDSNIYNVQRQIQEGTINNPINKYTYGTDFKLYEKNQLNDFLNGQNKNSVTSYQVPIIFEKTNEEIGIVLREVNEDGLYSSLIYFKKEVYVNYNLTPMFNNSNEINQYNLELIPQFAPKYGGINTVDIIDPTTNKKIGYVEEDFYNNFVRGNRVDCYLRDEYDQELIYGTDFSLNSVYDENGQIISYDINMLNKDLTIKSKTY